MHTYLCRVHCIALIWFERLTTSSLSFPSISPSPHFSLGRWAGYQSRAVSSTPPVASAWAPKTPTVAGVSFTMCKFTLDDESTQIVKQRHLLQLLWIGQGKNNISRLEFRYVDVYSRLLWNGVFVWVKHYPRIEKVDGISYKRWRLLRSFFGRSPYARVSE